MTITPHEGLAPRRATIPKAAAYVPCSTKTIRRRIADGSLTGYRFGRTILVDLNEVDSLLQPIPTVDRSRGGAA